MGRERERERKSVLVCKNEYWSLVNKSLHMKPLNKVILVIGQQVPYITFDLIMVNGFFDGAVFAFNCNHEQIKRLMLLQLASCSVSCSRQNTKQDKEKVILHLDLRIGTVLDSFSRR